MEVLLGDVDTSIEALKFDGVDSRIDVNNLSSELLMKLCKTAKNLLDALVKFCIVLLVLRFNSAKYDLNVIKKTLLQQLITSNASIKVLKKTNKFTALEFEHLLFLDILH